MICWVVGEDEYILNWNGEEFSAFSGFCSYVLWIRGILDRIRTSGGTNLSVFPFLKKFGAGGRGFGMSWILDAL